jgi:hypothetical protein
MIRLQDGFAYIPTTKNDEPRAVFFPSMVVAALDNLSQSIRVFHFTKSGYLYSLLRVAAFKVEFDLRSKSERRGSLTK